MGNQIDAKYYNEKLGNLLPITLKAIQNIEKTHLLFKNTKHPVMQAFSTKAIEEMKEIAFHSIYTVQARDGENFKIANKACSNGRCRQHSSDNNKYSNYN